MKKIFIYSVCLVLAFLAIFLLKGERIFYFILKPLQKDVYQKLIKKDSEENCQNLIAENSRLKIQQTENKTLRNYLGFFKDSEDSFVLADVIGQKSESGFTWFILNQGSKNGIKPGLAVVDEYGFLVGVIAETKIDISYLKPTFDKNFFLTADVINQSVESSDDVKKISGLVESEYGLVLKMKYIPPDRQVLVNDLVVTSGLDENIRRNIIVGKIVEVDKKPNAIFQEAVIELLADYDFRIVSIILPKKE